MVLGGGKRDKYEARHAHLMIVRAALLEEERGQDDVVDKALREIKQLSAPFIAGGVAGLVPRIETLNRELKELRMRRVKGIPEESVKAQPLEWLEQRVEQLWEEKVGVSKRRAEWKNLIAKTEAELHRVQSLPPPAPHNVAKPTVGGSDLDLDFDI
eukprot:TRINITY_DN15052_c0_g1_i1.p2 TRINITY_DN15052_c0_g1~~TRINITY_DN15052_c0_g1_i1.p2  ORF type:complete len:156 (+),score=60.72 TRINITY_DN15052_c0_g1_i1:325-792(+)